MAQEYDVIKSIMQTLAMFKGENHDTRQVSILQTTFIITVLKSLTALSLKIIS